MLPDSTSDSNSSPFLSRAVKWADVARWLRRALVRNPFYILSAGLLLLSMRLLSGDSGLFKDEIPQLIFNFSSFQVYELLLVGTAVVLARRKIWYDAGLLVGVETLFVCVPFILVSQALLLENQVVLAFCLGGCALAVLRMQSLKRRLDPLNMPVPLLWVGAVLLALNFAFPVLTRSLHQDLSVPAWDARGVILLRWEWNGVLPLVLSLAIFLPAATLSVAGERPEQAAFFARRSFPLLAVMLWTAGTATHLYCIGYVYGLPWAWSLSAPGLWVAAWIFWRRRDDLDFIPSQLNRAAHGAFLLAPLAVAVGAGGTGDWTRCCWLALLNVPLYGAVAAARRDWRSLHLALISGVVGLAAIPHEWLRPAAVHYDHIGTLAAALTIYLILLTIVSRSPRWGVLGGLALMVAVPAAFPRLGANGYLGIQVGLVFVLLHSLRWADARHSYARRLRQIVAGLWLLDGIIWMMADIGTAQFGTFLLGLTVVAVYFCARGILGQWGPRIVPYTALAMMALEPVCALASQVRETPIGVLVLIGSFLLFGFGTAAALTREKWHPAR